MIHPTHLAIAAHHVLAIVGLAIYGWWAAALALASGVFFTRVLAEHILHLGISHRHLPDRPLTHWLGVLAAVLVGQGSAISWSVVHRIHHAYPDTPDDPLSPFHHHPVAIWLNLIRVSQPPRVAAGFAKDLLRRPVHVFCHRHYTALHVALCAVLALVCPAALLLIVSPGVVYSFHVLGATNTLSHMYGETVEGSAGRNNTWVSMWALQRGNHASHHANPNSSR